MQQIDVDALLRLAAEHGSVVTVEAMPGTHVIRGDPLVRVDGEVVERTASSIRRAFTLGIARTPAQDVRFALQQLTEVSIRGLASGSNDPYTSVSALELAGAALVPLVRRDPAPQGRVDADGVVRVVVRQPSAEELLAEVFAGVRQYGLDHAAVVRAALALAGRLGAATRSPGIREVLVRQVDELLAAHRARVSDEVDRRVVADAGASVLDALRAEAH